MKIYIKKIRARPIENVGTDTITDKMGFSITDNRLATDSFFLAGMKIVIFSVGIVHRFGADMIKQRNSHSNSSTDSCFLKPMSFI